MSEASKNEEIEVKFVEIDQNALKETLVSLGATDHGEDHLREIIFYDKDLTWRENNKFIRARQTKKGTVLSYKHANNLENASCEEIQLKIDDIEQAKLILERIGLVAYREQEKKRHTFTIREIVIDIDTWPKIPTYVEIEGPDLETIKEMALRLNLDWSKVIFKNASWIIETLYKVPVRSYRYFTFDKQE